MTNVDGLFRGSSLLTLRGLRTPCGARRLYIFLGAAIVAGACIDPTAGHYTISDVREALGTTASLTVVARDERAARRSLDLAFAEIDRLQDVLSTYDPEAPLARLNRLGSIDGATPEMLAVLDRARHFWAISGGAFDITVQPVIDLYERTFLDLGRAPLPDELDRARSLVDFEQLRVDGNAIALGRAGMRITVDGIAKGFIIDRAVEVLAADGVAAALVDIGGDMRVLGRPQGRRAWTLGIRHPRDPETFLSTMEVVDAAVATSGDYEHYFVEDLSAHHLIDPRTGLTAREVTSVTVVAPTAMDADALATTVFVLGVEAGLGLVESLEDVDAAIVTAAQEVRTSSGWARATSRP